METRMNDFGAGIFMGILLICVVLGFVHFFLYVDDYGCGEQFGTSTDQYALCVFHKAHPATSKEP